MDEHYQARESRDRYIRVSGGKVELASDRTVKCEEGGEAGGRLAVGGLLECAAVHFVIRTLRSQNRL